MSDYCISVERLTKRYRLGQGGPPSDGLRHRLEEGIRSFLSSPVASVANNFAAKARGEFLALHDVSFQVKPGEVLGIIGRNGAGKSTLLKILSRITPPSGGQVRIRGRIASLLEVGTGFHPDLTGRENIYLDGAIFGMARAETTRKLDEIVAFAEIEKFVDTPVKRYSSGMYVRLAFAVAAHLEPEILVLDEVLAVGDAQFQKKCLGKMSEVSRNQGRAVLFVSHQMAAVRKLCRSAILLKAGRTDGPGAVEDVIQNYLGEMRSSERVLDLTGARQGDHGLQTARLEGLRVGDGCSLAYGEPLVFHLVFTAESTVSEGVLGVVFETTEGYRMMTLDSDVNGRTASFTKGTHQAVFRLPRNPLSPGLYNIGCALFSGGAVVDRCAAGVWEVVTGKSDLASNRGFGGCRPEFEVDFIS